VSKTYNLSPSLRAAPFKNINYLSDFNVLIPTHYRKTTTCNSRTPK
jgi:hypothetical protein